MRTLRAVARIALLFVAMIFFYALWLAGLPFAHLFPRLARRWHGFNFCGWARASARIAGMRIEVRGEPPRGAFLLVSNHLGYIDVITIAACTDCVFVAKSDVARWPLIGFICRTIGIIFIDRARKRSIPETIQDIERRRRRGFGVVIFPEGTSSSGDEVAPFKPSLLELAASGGEPVHHVALEYETPTGEVRAREAVCWWGDMPFGEHVYNLLRMPGFRATVAFGARPIVAEDRKELAERLHAAVRAEREKILARH